MAFAQKIWSFVKRHRRKFYVAGAVIGGLILLKRYSQRKIREWEENEMSDCFDRLKKEQHFESTQKTCKATAIGLMSNLHDRLVTLANCEEIREILKTRPPNKLDLWENLKCMSIARVVAGTYGCCLLVTILNVQLNIIGGYMFLDASPSSAALEGAANCSPKVHAPSEVQQKYLTLIERFMGPGCEKMFRFVWDATVRCVEKISLTEKLSIAGIQGILTEIRKELETSLNNDNFNLFSFVLSDEDPLGDNGKGTREEGIYARLLNETRDLFESDDCRNVLSKTLDSGFAYLIDAIAYNFVSDEKIEKDGFVNLNEITIPMAKVIPINCGLIRILFQDRAEQLVTQLLFSEAQKILGANIYEAFSQEQMSSDLYNHNSLNSSCVMKAPR